MLSNVFKYDLRFSSRLFFPLYLIYGVLSILARLCLFFYSSNNIFFELISGFSIAIYVLATILMFTAPIILNSVYVYQQFISRNAYLTFTLPVKASIHILSKLFLHIWWSAVTYMLAFFSIFIMILNTSAQDELISFWKGLLLTLQQISWVYYLEFAILLLVSLFLNPLCIYFSMAVGQMVNKHKVLASIGVYIALMNIMQVASVISSYLIGFGLNENISLSEIVNASGIIHFFFIFIILLCLSITAVLFLLTNYIFTHKLNLS